MTYCTPASQIQTRTATFTVNSEHVEVDPASLDIVRYYDVSDGSDSSSASKSDEDDISDVTIVIVVVVIVALAAILAIVALVSGDVSFVKRYLKLLHNSINFVYIRMNLYQNSEK